jgi:hypothetical protein
MEKSNSKNLSISNVKLQRYRHPSHTHKLFQNIIRSPSIFCDNQNCKRRLHMNEVTYTCFRCNFDLCAFCFLLPVETESYVDLNESDCEVNEDILFTPNRHIHKAKIVSIVLKNKRSRKRKMQDEDRKESRIVIDDEVDITQNQDTNEEYNEDLGGDEEEEICEDDLIDEDGDNSLDDEVDVTIHSSGNNQISNSNEQKQREQKENQPVFPVSQTVVQSSSQLINVPISSTSASIQFESKDYDDITTSTVNNLLSSVSGNLNLITVPPVRPPNNNPVSRRTRQRTRES